MAGRAHGGGLQPAQPRGGPAVHRGTPSLVLGGGMRGGRGGRGGGTPPPGGKQGKPGLELTGQGSFSKEGRGRWEPGCRGQAWLGPDCSVPSGEGSSPTPRRPERALRAGAPPGRGTGLGPRAPHTFPGPAREGWGAGGPEWGLHWGQGGPVCRELGRPAGTREAGAGRTGEEAGGGHHAHPPSTAQAHARTRSSGAVTSNLLSAGSAGPVHGDAAQLLRPELSAR